MSARIRFFPVDNGDMTLIELASGRTLLIDINIRNASEDSGDIPDVLEMLKKHLSKDTNGRYSVDAFLLTHPDQDHCRGLKEHFYLGPASDYPKNSDKIFVRELWSSPLIFRRASATHTLCDDAAAFNAEARRRVRYWQDHDGAAPDGERILILGEDVDGKTDDLGALVVPVGKTITCIAGSADGTFETRLLAPLPPSAEKEEEEALAKNLSSVVASFKVFSDPEHKGTCRFLIGGDAEVAIWEHLWDEHKSIASVLAYDLLLTPHHCSWHSLSYDSWSEKHEDAELNAPARVALGQARKGAVLIASSKPIRDDDDDPPCIRAKREYVAIAGAVSGEFICVMDAPKGEQAAPVIIEVEADGPKRKGKKSGPITPSSFSLAGMNPRPVDKRGGGRYA